LTRGVSPSDILPVLDEKDTQAQGVILGVIQQVLRDNSSVDGNSKEREVSFNFEKKIIKLLKGG